MQVMSDFCLYVLRLCEMQRKQRQILKLAPKLVCENHIMTKCLNLKRRESNQGLWPPLSLWEYLEWSIIWIKPQKNDPDRRNNSQWKKPGEQCLKDEKRQGRFSEWGVLLRKEQLELRRLAKAKAPKFWQRESSHQGLAVGRLDSCMGGFRKPWNEIKIGRGNGAVNRPLLRPKAWEYIIQKTSSAVRTSRVSLFHNPLKTGIFSSEEVIGHPPLPPSWPPTVPLTVIPVNCWI